MSPFFRLGYSLGVHLATVFTEMHASLVIHTYTFNGPGRGAFNVSLPDEPAEAQRIWEMNEERMAA